MARKIRSTETPSPLPVRVKLFGPNLSSSAQRKGYFHVHSSNCADNAHYGPGRKYGGDDRGETMTVTSRQAIVEEIYADHMAEDPSRTWEDFDDLYLAPCVNFGTTRLDPTLVERIRKAEPGGILDTSTGTLTRARRDEIIDQVANEVVTAAQAEGLPARNVHKSTVRWTRVGTAHYAMGTFVAKATGHNAWSLYDGDKIIAQDLPRLQAAKDLALATRINETEGGSTKSPLRDNRTPHMKIADRKGGKRSSAVKGGVAPKVAKRETTVLSPPMIRTLVEIGKGNVLYGRDRTLNALRSKGMISGTGSSKHLTTRGTLRFNQENAQS